MNPSDLSSNPWPRRLRVTTDDDGSPSRFVRTNHEMYYKIAVRNLNLLRRLYSKNAPNPDAVQCAATTSVLFFAMSLESFINHYASANLPRAVQGAADRLSLPQKWMIIPRLATGQMIDPGSSALEGLRRLYRLRNDLVHDKTLDKDIKAISERDWGVWLRDAEDALKTTLGLLQALSQLDSRVTFTQQSKV